MKAAATICIVDDDPDVLRSTAMLIKIFGFETVTYASGTDLIADYANLNGDCILIDQRMPGITGEMAIMELRRMGCDLPFILMSGHGLAGLQDGVLRNELADGRVLLMEKPFAPKFLKATLEQVINRTGP